MPYPKKTVWQLIMVPALITLVVTIVRLIGELQQWSPRFFSTEEGGGLAIVRIVWLVPIFGMYFALKLSHQDAGPDSNGKALGLNILGILIAIGGVFLLNKWEYLGYLVFLVSWIAFALSWGNLTKTLFSYGYAARIPVLIVMLIATAKNWTSHYNGYPSGPLFTTFGGKIWHGAVLPQMIFWITYTVAIGGLFGVVTAFFVKKPKVLTQPV